MSLWETFSNSIFARVIRQSDESTVVKCFQQCFRLFNMLTLKGCPESGLFRHLSNHIFRRLISEIHNLWGPYYFIKMFKIFRSLYNCIWIGSSKFFLLRKEYISWSINVLTNIPKMPDISRKDIFQLKFCQRYKTIWWKCGREIFSIFSDTLTCLLSKDVLKWDFLNI